MIIYKILKKLKKSTITLKIGQNHAYLEFTDNEIVI